MTKCGTDPWTDPSLPPAPLILLVLVLVLFLLLSLWSVALFGWGSLFERLLGQLPAPWNGEERTAFRIVLGHLPVVAMGYLVHLVVPLEGLPGLFMVIVGCAAAAREFFRSPPTTLTLCLFGSVTLLVSAFCARVMIHGDSGGYHTQAILWMAEEPVVRGLANLTSVFGYNTSWWILAALMSWPAGIPHGAAFVSGPVMIAAGMLIVGAILRLLRRDNSLADWFWVPALYLWLRQVVGVNTPSPTTDVPANLIIIAAVGLIARCGQISPIKLINSPAGRWFLALALLAATAKLSASPLLAAGLVWIGLTWIALISRRTSVSLAELKESFVRLLPLGFCGTVFLYHGWLLSGFPLFPSTLGNWMAAPWQLPVWLAEHTVERTRDWAFTFGASSEQLRTLPAWKVWMDGQSGLTNLVIAAVAAGGAIAGSILILRDRARILPALRVLWLPGTIALTGFIWNFSQVPALRFASGFVFCLLGCGFALVGPQLTPFATRATVMSWGILCVAALSKLALSRPIYLASLPPSPLPDPITERITKEGFFIRISAYSWFAPKPAIVSYEFDENLKVIREPSGRIAEFRGGKRNEP